MLATGPSVIIVIDAVKWNDAIYFVIFFFIPVGQS